MSTRAKRRCTFHDLVSGVLWSKSRTSTSHKFLTSLCVCGAGTRWYDVDTLAEVELSDPHSQKGIGKVVDAPIDKIPVFQRGGTIVSRKMRIRRSSKMMK